MRIGYMWVVRHGLTSVPLMDKAEHGDKEQLSGVIMKASYGEMTEGREGETCASALDCREFSLGGHRRKYRMVRYQGRDTRTRRNLRTEASAVASTRDWNITLGSTQHLHPYRQLATFQSCVYQSRILPSIRRASSTNLVRIHALHSPDHERVSLYDVLSVPHLPINVVSSRCESSRREYFDPEREQHELGQGSCPPLPVRSTTTVGGLKWCSLDVVGYSQRGRHLLTVLFLRQRNAKARKVSENTGENRDGAENKENRERRDTYMQPVASRQSPVASAQRI